MKKHLLALILISSFSTQVLAATSDDVLNQAAALYQQGQYNQAVSLYQSALQSDPNNWQLYQGLGSCFYQLHQLPEASQAFDESLALHPDNPSIRSFADSLRARLGNTIPATPTAVSTPAIGSTFDPGTQATRSPTAEPTLAIPTGEKQAREDFDQGKALEKKGRDELKKLDADHSLSLDDESIALYGAPKSAFYEPHFTLDWGVLTPSGANLDLGLFLDPTTNLGVAVCYFPVPTEDDYTYATIPGDLVYIEPRIKFYSSPSGLSTYQGFSFIYYGLHQGVDSTGYQYTSFDVFGLGYMFGFRTLPMDGMTMELGWKMGVAVISVNSEVYNYSNNTEAPGTTVVPFPYIIPEFRFGFTF